MNYMQALFGFGTFLSLAGVLLWAILGFLDKPALLSILSGSALLTVGYFFARLPHMYDLFRRDGAKAFLTIPLLLIGWSIFGVVVYAVGWAIGNFIRT